MKTSTELLLDIRQLQITQSLQIDPQGFYIKCFFACNRSDTKFFKINKPIIQINQLLKIHNIIGKQLEIWLCTSYNKIIGMSTIPINNTTQQQNDFKDHFVNLTMTNTNFGQLHLKIQTITKVIEKEVYVEPDEELLKKIIQPENQKQIEEQNRKKNKQAQELIEGHKIKKSNITLTQYDKKEQPFIIKKQSKMLENKNKKNIQCRLNQSCNLDLQHKDYINENNILYKNKLPINFMHSSTDYRKMLITNGSKYEYDKKNRSTYMTDDQIQDFQYINEKIYDLRKQNKFKINKDISKKKEKRKKKSLEIEEKDKNKQKSIKKQIKNNNFKKLKKNIKEKNNHKISKLFDNYQSEQQQMKHLFHSLQKKNNLKNNHLKNKSSIKQQVINSSISKNNTHHKSANINSLIKKSLKKFKKDKDQQKCEKKQLESIEKYHKNMLDEWNFVVRLNNSEGQMNPQSLKKTKQKSRRQLSLQYWNKIKSKINHRCSQNSIYQHCKKFSNSKNFFVQPDQISDKCIRQPLSCQMIEFLRVKRGKNAYAQQHRKEYQDRIRHEIISQNLSDLQKSRRKIIKKIKKIPFEPTSNMIQNAFKNIIEA